MNRTTSTLLPTLFLSHGGGPCFFMRGGMFSDIDADSPKANFLTNLIPSLHLPSPPKSLIIVSAHWEGERDEILIQSNAQPPLLFDYYGFPPESYKITWPAPGSPTIATRISTLLQDAGFKSRFDNTRGFDHGVFVPLKLSFPNADIPTIQVSLHASLDLSRHIALGRALAPLRKDGALIIGSGFATHNLSDMTRTPGSPPTKWAQEWDAWLAKALNVPRAVATRTAFTRNTPSQSVPWSSVSAALLSAPTAPHFSRAHPRVEHLLPLYVALGAADPSALLSSSSEIRVNAASASAISNNEEGMLQTTELFSQIVMGTASLSSYRFDS